MKLTVEEFVARKPVPGARRIVGPQDEPISLVRAGGAADLANSNGRIVRYVFSTPSVARDGHTIQGWDVASFLTNPVFLWAHDADDLPIGKVVDLDAGPTGLRGGVQYATADENPFADTVYRLVQGGYLNATSVSWLPIQWSFSKDKSRPGGIDFKLAELLEISQVPVPAQPEALATARAAGIDTGPLYRWAEKVLDTGGMMLVPRDELEQLRREAKMPTTHQRAAADWKCGAARDLPIDTESAWDGPAAAQSVFEHAGFDGDKPDLAFVRQAFLAYDAANADEKGSYKEPIAKVVDGKLVAVSAGIHAAASRLPQTSDLPEAVHQEAQAVIDAYEKRIEDEKGSRAVRLEARKRSLWDVGDLAYLLMQMVWTQVSLADEAEWEQDGSPLPAQLADLAKQLGAFLKALTGEEVDELVARLGGDETARAARRDFVAALGGLDAGARTSLLAAMRHAQAGKVVTITVDATHLPLARAGKVLSTANEAELRAIHGAMTDGCTRLMTLIDDATAPAEDDPILDDGTVERALRERKARARALALKHNAGGAAA